MRLTYDNKTNVKCQEFFSIRNSAHNKDFTLTKYIRFDILNYSKFVLVAQLDRASDSDSEGRWFDSSQARQTKKGFAFCKSLFYFEILHLVQNDTCIRSIAKKETELKLRYFFARQCGRGEVVSGIPRDESHDALRKKNQFLYIETEKNDVAIFHNIFLTFGTN